MCVRCSECRSVPPYCAGSKGSRPSENHGCIFRSLGPILQTLPRANEAHLTNLCRSSRVIRQPLDDRPRVYAYAGSYPTAGPGLYSGLVGPVRSQQAEKRQHGAALKLL